MRYFKVTGCPKTKYSGRVGELIGDVDYSGCKSGWHTLKFEEGQEGMYTGDEVSEVKIDEREIK